LNKIEFLCQSENESIRNRENREKLVKLQKMFVGNAPVVYDASFYIFRISMFQEEYFTLKENSKRNVEKSIKNATLFFSQIASFTHL
jgi:hypothetical protein